MLKIPFTWNIPPLVEQRLIAHPARCITADPPWPFKDRLPGKGRGAVKHYKTMKIDAICELPLPPHQKDCWLFFWRVASMQKEALLVIDAWGFEVKSEIVWVKLTKDGNPHRGMGRYVRNGHEIALVCRRKKGRVQPVDKSQGSVIMTGRGIHSQKPEAFYQKVERIVGPGPFVELFGRKQRPGWVVLGDQANP